MAVKRKGSTYRQEQAAATRERIASAARKLFVEHGYGATTLAAIAAEAGVAEPTVYAVFGSKKGLLPALRQQMHAEVELPRLTAEATAAPDAGRKLEGWARLLRRQILNLRTATDIVWAFSNEEIYRELVHERGWSPDRYETWMARTLKEQLLAVTNS
jgi:AcrR family transcriptional regulator